MVLNAFHGPTPPIQGNVSLNTNGCAHMHMDTLCTQGIIFTHDHIYMYTGAITLSTSTYGPQHTVCTSTYGPQHTVCTSTYMYGPQHTVCTSTYGPQHTVCTSIIQTSTMQTSRQSRTIFFTYMINQTSKLTKHNWIQAIGLEN